MITMHTLIEYQSLDDRVHERALQLGVNHADPLHVFCGGGFLGEVGRHVDVVAADQLVRRGEEWLYE